METLPPLPLLPSSATVLDGYIISYAFVLHITDEPSFDDDATKPRTLILFQNGSLQTTNGEPHGHWRPIADNVLQLCWDHYWFSKGSVLAVHNFKRIIYTNIWQRSDYGVPVAHVQYLIQVATELPFERPSHSAASYRFPNEVPTPGVLPPHCTPKAGYTAEYLFVVHTTGDPSFGDDCRRPLILSLFRNGMLQTNHAPPHGNWQPIADRCLQLQWDPVWGSKGHILKLQTFKSIVFTKVWQRSDDECETEDKQYLIPVSADVQILRITN